MRSNGHRYAIKRNPLPSLLSHFSEQGESDSVSLCAHTLIPTFLIDTLSSWEPTGNNKKQKQKETI